MKPLALVLVVAVASGMFACRSQHNPQNDSIAPAAWISIRHGTPPHCFIAMEKHDAGTPLPCADVGPYLTTRGLPQGSMAKITAYNSDGIAWPEVRVVVESLTAAGYLNAGILTPKAGFVQE